jgi:hypothetical protein
MSESGVLVAKRDQRWKRVDGREVKVEKRINRSRRPPLILQLWERLGTLQVFNEIRFMHDLGTMVLTPSVSL